MSMRACTEAASSQNSLPAGTTSSFNVSFAPGE
jgi:hypothetical protein